MRGSPLIRTLMLAVFLLLAGLGFRAFQQRKTGEMKGLEAREKREKIEQMLGYEMTFSAPILGVKMWDQDGTLVLDLGALEDGELGELRLQDELRSVKVEVSWKQPVPNHGFMRLTLEPPRKASLEHVFEGTGETLQGYWQIP